MRIEIGKRISRQTVDAKFVLFLLRIVLQQNS